MIYRLALFLSLLNLTFAQAQSLSESRFSIPADFLWTVVDSAKFTTALEEARNLIEIKVMDGPPTQVYMRIEVSNESSLVSLHTRSMEKVDFRKLEKKINSLKWPKTTLPFSAEVLTSYQASRITLNKTFDPEISPLIESPLLSSSIFRDDLVEYYEWYRKIILPYYAEHLQSDSNQSARLNYGYVLESRIRSDKSFDPLLYAGHSPRFWRAMIESKHPTELLLIASALHGVNQEYERSTDLILLASHFEITPTEDYIMRSSVRFANKYLSVYDTIDVQNYLHFISPHDPLVLAGDSKTVHLLPRYAPLFINPDMEWSTELMQKAVYQDNVSNILSKENPDVIEWYQLIDACYAIGYHDLGCMAAWMVFDRYDTKEANLRFIKGLILLEQNDILGYYPKEIVEKARDTIID